MVPLYEGRMTDRTSPAKKGTGLWCGLARLEQKIDSFARHSPLEHYLFQRFEERTVSKIFRRHVLVENLHDREVE